MKRYSVFVMRFALAPIISGTFVVSMTGRSSLIEWAHIIGGFATVYLIIGLVLCSAVYRESRLSAAAALVAGLLEAIPSMPRLHAAISPVLFATLVWVAVDRSAKPKPRSGKSLRIFLLPALVLLAIVYGVGYRHQSSGILPHISAAMLAGGVVLGFCMLVNQNHAADKTLCGISNLTIAAVLFQITAGITTMVIRMLEIEGGLTLALARTAHITGAAPLLGASTLLAIQYRRRVV